MWTYEKKLQYPIKISTPNPDLAMFIISQYGGPNGELAASLRYLSQRYSAPYNEIKALLTDIGTEELAHMEMICSIVQQLTRNLTDEQIKNSKFSSYFIDQSTGVYPVNSAGVPFSAKVFAVTGDIIADLTEDLAADGTTA